MLRLIWKVILEWLLNIWVHQIIVKIITTWKTLVSKYLAAQSGHRNIVEILLLNGAEVDIKDKNGETPLHWGEYNFNKNA